MTQIKFTELELEAVRWAVGNFEQGDADDCNGKARLLAMRSAYKKITDAESQPPSLEAEAVEALREFAQDILTECGICQRSAHLCLDHDTFAEKARAVLAKYDAQKNENNS